MPRPSPLLPSERPDPLQPLLVAVAEGDGPRARRLVDQLVHRRGVAALEQLLAGVLLRSQGTSAVAWLQQQIGGELTTAPAGLQPGSAEVGLPVAVPPEPPAAVDPAMVPAASAVLAAAEPEPAPVACAAASELVAAPSSSVAVAAPAVADEAAASPVAAPQQEILAMETAAGESAAGETAAGHAVAGQAAASLPMAAAATVSSAERLRALPAANAAPAALVPPAPAPALVRRLRAWLPEEEPLAGEDPAYPQAS